MFWENFLHGNEWQWRLLRTIVQGILSILIASVDMIVDGFTIDPAMKPIVVAAIMAILSPIMSALGNNVYEKRMRDEVHG